MKTKIVEWLIEQMFRYLTKHPQLLDTALKKLLGLVLEARGFEASVAARFLRMIGVS